MKKEKLGDGTHETHGKKTGTWFEAKRQYNLIT